MSDKTNAPMPPMVPRHVEYMAALSLAATFVLEENLEAFRQWMITRAVTSGKKSRPWIEEQSGVMAANLDAAIDWNDARITTYLSGQS